MIYTGEIDEYIEMLREAKLIGSDTENTGTIRPAELWSGQYYCTGFSTCIRVEKQLWSRYFPFRHNADNLDRIYLHQLKEILETKQLGFHNIVIDLAALETLGIYITIPPHDTTVMAHMVNEEFPSKALDWLSKFILKDKKDKDKLYKYTNIWGWDDVPVWLMNDYACHDAELQFQLMEIFLQEMQP